jgi:cobalamin synthase
MLLYAYAPTGDTQSIYTHRHQLTFAFFAFSVFVFFLIAKKIFKDWKIGLLGSLFLILSPRIFVNSFYNPKDIPFLSAYVIAVFTMLLFIEKKNFLTAVLHGLATGMVVNIRTPGLAIIPITFLFYLFDLVLAREPLNLKNLKASKYFRGVILGISYLAIAAGLIILTFPLLYTDPFGNFIKTFDLMKDYPWVGYQLYMGKNIQNHIPWHYSIVWFAISSPIFYLILFIIGITTLIYKTARARIRAHFQAMRDFYVVGTCGILPIIVVIVMKSNLYTDNRQMYFCYPMLLLISLYGFKFLLEKIKEKTIHWQIWVGAVLVLGLAYPVYFMIHDHPHQYLYFNFLAGTKLSDIKYRYTLDGWGLSVKEGLEFIVKTDADQKIRVQVYDGSKFSYNILPKSDSDRLYFTNIDPEYVIRNYYSDPFDPYAPGKKVYSVKVGDTSIIDVFKIDRNANLSP